MSYVLRILLYKVCSIVFILYYIGIFIIYKYLMIIIVYDIDYCTNMYILKTYFCGIHVCRFFLLININQKKYLKGKN